MLGFKAPTLDSSPSQGATSTSGPTTGGSTNAVCCPEIKEIGILANLRHEYDKGDEIMSDFISQLRKDQIVKRTSMELGDQDFVIIVEEKQKANIDDDNSSSFFDRLEGDAKAYVNSAGIFFEVDKNSLKAELLKRFHAGTKMAMKGRVAILRCNTHQDSVYKVQVLQMKDIFDKVSLPFPAEYLWREYIIREETIRC
jgi:hypothetical protein